MNIHYFSAVLGKENVATSNTMRLFSRLYSYLSDKFFHLSKSQFSFESIEPGISFNIQNDM